MISCMYIYIDYGPANTADHPFVSKALRGQRLSAEEAAETSKIGSGGKTGVLEASGAQNWGKRSLAFTLSGVTTCSVQTPQATRSNCRAGPPGAKGRV